MDRTLVAEFPAFSVEVQVDNVWTLGSTDTRAIATQTYLQEMKLDLSGYVQSDLTVGFRRSFEQKGGLDRIFWLSFEPKTDSVIELTLISSVPMSDEQLSVAWVSNPGFIPYSVGGAFDWGNFNRTHIIHGRLEQYFPNSIIGSSSFTSTGNATLMHVTDNYFSSLEPTAADCLYCYRVFVAPPPGDAPGQQGRDGVTQLTIPAKRVILDAFTVEEPDLEYMMRLKRSYELANQV